jgi:2-polyprenyl-6-methoxyphenol hydroxylase-like FAD-dependent oxidoreductase
MDLRQTLLEPILVRYAALKSWQCRFDTQFISFVQNEEAKTVDVSVQDKITHRAYTIRAKYLFGADGARSQICRQLELPMAKLPGKGSAVNILVEADISHGIANRQGNLHWLMQPAVSHPEYGWIACVRMVKPWNEWIFSLFPSFGKEFPDGITHKQYVKRIKEFIGDEHIEVKILQVSKWTIIETYAELYSKGQVFAILGRLWMMIFLLTKSTVSVWETVHRHPPFNGLGSNTSIQDAYNLAWKVAYVLKGTAVVLGGPFLRVPCSDIL